MKPILLTLLMMAEVAIASANASYVGDKACAACHTKETKAWHDSDHANAMHRATEETVKADFNNTTFTYNGITTTFYKKGNKFMVRTEGPDGKLHDYTIDYTFGIYPLQQYMITFPKGRVQVLDPAWDNRPKAQGGQRWYHIHPDENISAGDVLHWTGPNMNWNYMCADCHSTNLKKNYDAKTHAYHTTYSAINVSCEACHGPASEHVAWAKGSKKGGVHKGFVFHFIRPIENNASLEKKKVRQAQQMQVCAKCHSRRAQLDEDFVPGSTFTDHYLPVLLDEGLYFPDGKIEDEVYVYNSFQQSKMYANGVTCTDCHDPHSLDRKAPGEKVCYQCHAPERYASVSHHRHKAGSASCIDCHMPARTYMGVDSRNDHSFRIPRPDISVAMPQIPNACNLCHRDKNASWAAKSLKDWYGKTPVGKQNFAHAMRALRIQAPDAPKALYSVLTGDAPDIAKITATTYLGNYPSQQTYMTTMQMLRHSNARMRRAALQSLEHFPPKLRMRQTFRMLSDTSKIVRIEAARQLASFPLGKLDAGTKAALEKGFDEYEKSLLFSAERPESQLSLGIYYANRHMDKKAEAAYKEALHLQPKFVPAYVNYSNFLMQRGQMKEAKAVLEKGLKQLPQMGILHHALGLWYVRNKEKQKGLETLKDAYALEPDNARFAYVYAVALAEKSPQKAIAVLESAYKKHPGSRELLSALVYYHKQLGHTQQAQAYEKRLKALEKVSVR